MNRLSQLPLVFPALFSLVVALPAAAQNAKPDPRIKQIAATYEAIQKKAEDSTHYEWKVQHAEEGFERHEQMWLDETGKVIKTSSEMLYDDGKSIIEHYFKDGALVFSFQLTDAAGDRIQVTEDRYYFADKKLFHHTHKEGEADKNGKWDGSKVKAQEVPVKLAVGKDGGYAKVTESCRVLREALLGSSFADADMSFDEEEPQPDAAPEKSKEEGTAGSSGAGKPAAKPNADKKKEK